MSKKNLKISYDKESQVLSVRRSSAKSVDSDISGNVVIDYDKNGEIAKINFYDFDFRQFRGAQKDLKQFAQRSGSVVSVR